MNNSIGGRYGGQHLGGPKGTAGARQRPEEDSFANTSDRRSLLGASRRVEADNDVELDHLHSQVSALKSVRPPLSSKTLGQALLLKAQGVQKTLSASPMMLIQSHFLHSLDYNRDRK